MEEEMTSPAQAFDAGGPSGEALQSQSLQGVGARGELPLGLDGHLTVVPRRARHP